MQSRLGYLPTGSAALLLVGAIACTSSIGGESPLPNASRDAAGDSPAADAATPPGPAPDPSSDAAPAGADAATRPDAGTPPEDAAAPDRGAPEAGAPEAGAPDAAPDAGSPAARTRARIMFSGHSLLDNPLPDDFDRVASSLAKDVNWNQQNVIGSAIRVRTRGAGSGWDGYRTGKNRRGRDLNIIEELRNPATLGPGEQYDTLVITENHRILEQIRWENTLGYLRHYHDRLIDGNAQGATYLYQVWLDIDKDDPQPWIDFTRADLMTWECVASKTNLTLPSARPAAVRVIPGGYALTRLVDAALAGSIPGLTGTDRAKLDAIFRDNVHLHRVGVYFLALVHYATVFEASPVGAASPSEVSAATAAALQTLAWDVVSTYDQAAAGARPMADCRAAIADLCPDYMRLVGRLDQVGSCGQWATTAASWNPFQWPDPNWSPLPAP